MKIYTRTGDSGQTSLIGGQRVSKDDARMQVIGAIDELNASLGVAISFLPAIELNSIETLTRIQNHLFDIGAEVANWTDQPAGRHREALTIPTVSDDKITWLEQTIDQFDAELSQLTAFILPGGDQAASLLHLARTICRRAERNLVTLSHHCEINPAVLRYINRLSDLLFTLARAQNARSGHGDVPWNSR